MYKIMLADDEGIVIDSLRFIIEKEYGSDCEIKSAKTGRQVIELAESFQPDIAFMDIQMPGINGIEAMREIKKFNSHIIFIVMTAYDKFDYAKEAISLGVLDYLNKPVNKDKIIEVINKAISQIDRERTKRSNDLLIKEKLETVVPIIENGLIQDLLFKEYFQEDIDNYKMLLQIDSDYGYMACLVFGREQVGNYMTSAVAVSIQAQKAYNQIHTIAEDYLPGGVMGAVMSNKIPILIPCKESELAYNDRNQIVESARALCRKLSERLDMNFRVGFGSVKPLSQMSESYEEAVSVLIQTTNHVAHIDDMPKTSRFEADYPSELEKQIFDDVASGHVDSATASAGLFFDWMQESHENDINDIRLKCLEFALRAESEVYTKTGKMYQFKSRSNYLPTVLGYTSMADLRQWFTDKIKSAAFAISNERQEQNDSIVSHVMKYIDENFNKEITLDDVSKLVNVSSYYFSKLFKDETGENFIDYLTKKRIEEAKRLLLSSGKSMKEIAREVGYADPNYFSRIFKKYTGKTPTEFSEKR